MTGKNRDHNLVSFHVKEMKWLRKGCQPFAPTLVLMHEKAIERSRTCQWCYLYYSLVLNRRRHSPPSTFTVVKGNGELARHEGRTGLWAGLGQGPEQRRGLEQPQNTSRRRRRTSYALLAEVFFSQYKNLRNLSNL